MMIDNIMTDWCTGIHMDFSFLLVYITVPLICIFQNFAISRRSAEKLVSLWKVELEFGRTLSKLVG